MENNILNERTKGLDVTKESSTIITDISKANWAFRKLVEIEKKVSEVEALAKAELERINEWKNEELKAFENDKQFFNFNLEQYFREQKELDPKFKLSTPYGKVTSRKQQPKWNYEDEKLIDYIENYSPGLIRIKKEIDKVGFKKAVAEEKVFAIVEGGRVVSNTTGEYLEGITVVEREDSVIVKVIE